MAEYLVCYQGFSRLYIEKQENVRNDFHIDQVSVTNTRPKSASHAFSNASSLLDFVTKRWQQRWVTTDIWSEDVLEDFLRRPSFLLVSVDAPVSLRWARLKAKSVLYQFRRALLIEVRCEERQAKSPSLEEFVISNDHHLYHPKSGFSCLIDRAEVRLINRTTTMDSLHKTLEDLNLGNEQRLRPNWDQYFMQLASLAAQRSNCMKRRVGCVLVREKRVISTGYNGTPRNLRNCNEGGCKSASCLEQVPVLIQVGPRCNSGASAGVDLSTCLCIHAEENALLEAGRERIREGSILYCDT